MSLLPPRNSSHDESSGKIVIPAVCEEFFEGDERKVEMVGEEVEAEEDGGNIGREEFVDEVGRRVVIGCGEGRSGGEGVVPGAVKRREGGVWGMKSVAMESVGEDLAQEQATEEVFEYSPGNGERGANLQCAAGMENLGEEVLDSCLEEHA